jgi:hypothetical protein
MLKVTYECDLCKKKSAEVSRGHAGAIRNEDNTLNYNHIDQVNFPAGWVNVGFSAMCSECLSATTSIIDSKLNNTGE